MRTSTSGLLCGVFAAVAYGLMPLCVIPLTGKGMTVETILFYRFSLGGLALAVWMFIRREPFHASLPDLGILAALSVQYTLAALSVFAGYFFLPSGVVTSIHFLYPVAVATLMMIFFGEKKSPATFLALALAVGGVALLSLGEDSGGSAVGIGIVLFSALVLALYLVGMDWAGRRRALHGPRISLYVLLFGSLPCLIVSVAMGRFTFFPDAEAAFLGLALALLTATLAIRAFNYSIQTIGPTMTSIIGAMEPLTAVVMGTIAFGEPLTFGLALGIGLVLAAVGCVMLAPHLARGGDH